ncbi:MAG: hypothetical protein LAT64_01945 [Phycisphaerales bacterium]|nr:hypothetical protein [Planctomycetota bacterium]MCH8507521.1 hypothetical protein [Phycisphaerales bacterium]
MLPLALILFTLGLVLLAFALRGRVAARGRFCRKCRFDLQGHGPDAAACPECGRELARPGSTRPVLRRSRPVVLTLGVLLFLAGTTLLAISATNNTARIFAALPDRVVLALHAVGVDAAFTEIATNRLDRTPALADRAWEGLILAALEHQSDDAQPWNPRHGEVLMRAFEQARMDPAQIDRYFANGFVSSVSFTQTLRHGADEIGFQVSQTSGPRLASLSGSNGLPHDGTDDVWQEFSVTAGGLRDPAFEVPLPVRGMTGLDIPGPVGGGMGSISSKIPLADLDWTGVEPGTELVFFVRYAVSMRRMSDGHVHHRAERTVEHPVRVLPSDAETVRADADPETVAAFRESPIIRITPLRILPKDQRTRTDQGWDIGEFGIITVDPPIALSGRIVAIHEGREHHIADFAMDAATGHGIRGRRWRTENPPEDAVLDAWLDAGRVTIELRPDPRPAERLPGVVRILGVPLRFENARVTADPIEHTQTSATLPEHTVGRPGPDHAED